MLKGIPSILTPELLKILMEMGHGDELVIADGNFPVFAYPQRVVRCDGHNVPKILDAVLKFVPLDPYAENPVVLMKVPADDDYKPQIWDKYKAIGLKHEEKGLRQIHMEKLDFYERTRKAYAVVTTSETELYANIVIRKGVVIE